MLNYRTSLWVFLPGLLIGLLLARFAHFSWWWPVAISLLWLGLLVFGSIEIRSGFFIRSICAGNKDRRRIALTFDDGPAAANTGLILDILAEEKVEAAFFCIGKRIRGNETLLMRMVQEGHIVGNHSHDHGFWFDLQSTQRMLENMRRMDETCKAVTGRTPRLFRPPYGVTNPMLARAIRLGGYYSIGWSLRSLDTVYRDPEKLLRRLKKGLKPGAILLLHDTGVVTAETLSQFIRFARDCKYEIVRLDRLLQMEPYV